MRSAHAASKIAAEFLLKHLSVDYQLPVVLVRIFSFYGPRGGGVTQRIDQMIRDQPVSVYPGVRNVHTPLYEDDYVEKTIAAAGIAKIGAEIVNVGGTEAVTTQEYCQMAGEILGKEPVFVENSKAWPIWADTTKMVELLGSEQGVGSRRRAPDDRSREGQAAYLRPRHRRTGEGLGRPDDYLHRSLAGASSRANGMTDVEMLVRTPEMQS